MPSEIDPQPMIVAFVSDLMFAEQIVMVGKHLGYQVRVIDTPAQFLDNPASDPAAPPRVQGEHLYGPGSAVLAQLTQWLPALLVFDLGSTVIPWRSWLPVIKSVPATRRIPALCFGPHVDAEAMTAARDRGADVVVSRGKFANAMAALITEHARSPDYAALRDTCTEPLSALAQQGIAEFNAGEFYEAHETLEHAWNEDTGPGRDLYRAILQVAVAYYQIQRGNYRGAAKMFLRVRQWIDPLPDVCRGVDVAQLRADAAAVEAALQAFGPQAIGDFDPSLFRPVIFSE